LSQDVIEEEKYAQAADHLRTHDPVLARLIDQFGLFTPRPHRDYYQQLLGSIIGQQLSVKAAASIKQRFKDIYGGEYPAPQQLIETGDETLRAAGLSRAKVTYVQDLARHVMDGSLRVDELPHLSNQEIIKELVAVKGIGEWTAHMFLMFAVGRLDVLPTGDLGVRNGIRTNYGFDHAPTPDECAELAKKNSWHPYESVASWYMWQSLDNEPK
jgi:DNA-3-methyladenine glycosylase II